MAPHYMGLTWDHPRGYRAIEAAGARADGLSIDWHRQPLAGFESHPIDELCENYDLIVLDHPHIGEAVALDCLQPLDRLIATDELKEIAAATVGPCLASYTLHDHVWALPLDAAAQVTAYRPDLLPGDPPRTWEDILRLTQDGGATLSLAGPHALLTLLSIAAGFDAVPGAGTLFEESVGAAAFTTLRTIHGHCERRVLDKSPVEILEYMARAEDVFLCPLVFGYVNYTRPADGAHRLAFTDAPRRIIGGRPGSTVGGTGLGISKRCEVSPQLIEYILWLMSAAAQCEFIPRHGGQPSRRDAWTSGKVNAAWGQFYTSTLESIEAAYIRPRHFGFVALQLQASEMIRQALDEGSDGQRVIAELNALNRILYAQNGAIPS